MERWEKINMYPEQFLFLGTSRSMTVDERSQRFTPCCDVRISHPSSPETRFRAQRLYERDARQVERKIKRAPFSPRASQRYYAVMWILSFLRGFHESPSRSRRIKSSFIMSRARARALQFAAPNWTMRKMYFKSLYLMLPEDRERQLFFSKLCWDVKAIMNNW